MTDATPQAALLSAQNPLLKRCYTMSESHLFGYRVVIGFERLEDAQDAHEYIAKLQATQEPVQAGELPDEREAFEAWAESVWHDTSKFEGRYKCVGTHTVWVAWQARAALSARKPLPAQDRRKLWAEHEEVAATFEVFDRVVTLTERAHGIGGNHADKA